MQINNIDKNINDKLKNRTLKPSISAWERLSAQLDQEKTRKKKKRIEFLSYAACIVLLISIGFFYLDSGSDESVINEEIIVETALDTFKIKEVDLKQDILVEKAVVKLSEETKKNNNVSNVIKSVDLEVDKKASKNIRASNIEESVAVIESVKREKSKGINDFSIKEEIQSQPKKKIKSRIKINSDYLLFAVTHSSEEVKEYYAKYEINRNDVLDVIQDELTKSKLKINPETILAEVELNIEESDFKQNFMSKLKLKLSDVIVSIADRNK